MIWRSITLFSVGLLGSWIAWQVVDRYPPVVIYSAKAETRGMPGGVVRIAYVINRLRQCASIVDRVIVDSRQTRFILDSYSFATGAGPVGQEQYVAMIPVPAEAALGPAIYRTTSRFVCGPLNALWPIYAPPREVPFTIGP